MTSQNYDPCDTIKLKAEQQNRLQEVIACGKAIGQVLMLLGLMIITGAITLFLTFTIGPWKMNAAIFSALAIAALGWIFRPSIQLYACRLQQRFKPKRPR